MSIKDYITTYKSDKWFVIDRARDGCRRPVVRIITENGRVRYVDMISQEWYDLGELTSFREYDYSPEEKSN